MSAVNKAKSNAFVDATAGAIAGCAARFVVGPLDVIKIRFQVQLEPIAKRAAGVDPTTLSSKYTGLRQALATIVKEEGVAVQPHRHLVLIVCPGYCEVQPSLVQGLWRGTLPGQLLTVPYTAVQFVTLQQVRYFAHHHGISGHMGGKSLSFVSGAMAGAAATIASYPFDILRTTLAAQGEPKVFPKCHDLNAYNHRCCDRPRHGFLCMGTAMFLLRFTLWHHTHAAQSDSSGNKRPELVLHQRQKLACQSRHLSADIPLYEGSRAGRDTAAWLQGALQGS